jgi:hypothetical protein
VERVERKKQTMREKSREGSQNERRGESVIVVWVDWNPDWPDSESWCE